MSVGPLRRLTGAIGLMALVPISTSVITDRIDVTTAALRAAAVLLAVVMLGRIANWTLSRLAATIERGPATAVVAEATAPPVQDVASPEPAEAA